MDFPSKFKLRLGEILWQLEKRITFFCNSKLVFSSLLSLGKT